MSENICPCCGNHCSRDSLKCGRGRAYFGTESAHGEMHGGHRLNENEEEAVRLLRRCGHALHHGEGLNTDALTKEEKDRLSALLKKCLGE